MAAFVFIIAASTDGLDGYIARKNKIVTNLGKLLDPFADKLLVAAVLISLVEMDKLDAWIAIVIISREFAVTGLRQIALARRHRYGGEQMGQMEDGRSDHDDYCVVAEQFPVCLSSIFRLI